MNLNIDYEPTSFKSLISDGESISVVSQLIDKLSNYVCSFKRLQALRMFWGYEKQKGGGGRIDFRQYGTKG